jgi:hypothetical protein
LQLLAFMLACYSVTNILTSGRIFLGFRDWLGRKSAVAGHWVRCPMCVAVPVGGAWVLAGLSPGTGGTWLLELVAGASISSGGCWILSVVMRRLGEDAL